MISPCDRTQPLEKLCRDDSSGRWLECRPDSDPEEPREWIVWLVAACVALVLVRSSRQPRIVKVVENLAVEGLVKTVHRSRRLQVPIMSLIRGRRRCW